MRLPVAAQAHALTMKGPLSVDQMSLNINHRGRYRGPQQRAKRITSIEFQSSFATKAVSRAKPADTSAHSIKQTASGASNFKAPSPPRPSADRCERAAAEPVGRISMPSRMQPAKAIRKRARALQMV